MASMAEVPVYMLPGVPVIQPPHLEGLSNPALSTEILPGPPSLLSVQQAAQRRDPKKPAAVVSYLPTSDPGSTYSGLMGPLSGSDVDGPRRKRARVDKSSAAGRAQRASARNLNNTFPASDPVVAEEFIASSTMPAIPDSDPFPVPPDSDGPSNSRANSAPRMEDNATFMSNGKSKTSRKDKGKGKEVEKSQFRVKEESMATLSLSPDPGAGLLNEDHCSACRSLGSLVYCDGCPRAFHLWCLDPPMEAVDLPEGDKWFCPGCTVRKYPPPKPPPSLIAPLIHHAQISLPREYQLPDDIRTFFKDVGAGPKGTYVDTSQVKQPRLNRHGQLEDRDPYRLRDRVGAPVLCFRCGASALPSSVAAATSSSKRARKLTEKALSGTPEVWKSMLSCDYCSLHWHLDCLDPPLASMPPFGKKWMCPNHTDQVLHPKRRTPKQNVTTIDIAKPNQFNNGNIDIVHPQATPVIPKLVMDEVLINGRLYKVPEKVIMLDFWNKVSKDRHPKQREPDLPSDMSSPLTSLSSLDGLEADVPPTTPLPSSFTFDELHVAQMLCGLRHAKSDHGCPLLPSESLKVPKKKTALDKGAQTEPQDPWTVIKPVKETPRSSLMKVSGLFISMVSTLNPIILQRKAPTKPVDEDIRDKSLHNDLDSKNVSSERLSPAPASSKRARISVKSEVEDGRLGLLDKAKDDGSDMTGSAEAEGRVTRSRRKSKPNEKIKEITASMSGTQAATSTASVSSAPTVSPMASTSNITLPVDSAPAPAPALPPAPAPSNSSKPTVSVSQSGTSSTPVLKIRLPPSRLNVANSTSSSISAAPTIALESTHPTPSSIPRASKPSEQKSSDPSLSTSPLAERAESKAPPKQFKRTSRKALRYIV
ncbi:hypothetical protein SERLA73DRAFT_170540 [Serpula lacrymans var. lacrymans S7.3]|uniref:PHD-type domain-containing protein n=1 Tax=Serpula lacrymans var. lacrymans (strain S7.3) TaxID=936435 RepID=F8Q687_SERL3|nr:hypothetical protein SERLA73DRAFT_170540 [Serpula lacrymans var. lacrymans S7.3]